MHIGYEEVDITLEKVNRDDGESNETKDKCGGKYQYKHDNKK